MDGALTAEPTPVMALPALAPWFGGKRLLARRLVARIEAIPHRLYAEPFVGMGGVFFRRSILPTAEAINDRSGDVVNLFRVVKHHPEALLSELRLQLVSRADFERLMKLDPLMLTDIQRAARFLALQRMTYGERPTGQSFAVRRYVPRNFSAGKLRELMEAAHDRLSRVTIECLDFAEFLARYDGPETLFYCDPPYFGNERRYGSGLFCREDFERLAGCLSRLKGRFVLSINDCPEMRACFAGFEMAEEHLQYSMRGQKMGTELVIWN